jgi:hypothetical protein
MEALALKTVQDLDAGEWRVVATLKDRDRARLPPFEAIELDLAAVLGLNENPA